MVRQHRRPLILEVDDRRSSPQETGKHQQGLLVQPERRQLLVAASQRLGHTGIAVQPHGVDGPRTGCFDTQRCEHTTEFRSCLRNLVLRYRVAHQRRPRRDLQLAGRRYLAGADQNGCIHRADAVGRLEERENSRVVTAPGLLVPLDDAGSTPVRLGLGNGQDSPYQGQLDFVDNQFNSSTGTLQYRAVIANPEGLFRPGQFARVQMPVAAASKAILIDQKAVLTDQDRRYVYVLDEGNRATRRFVETGRRVDGLLVIRGGLQSGDRVVVNGLQKILYPGIEVAPQLVAMDRRKPAGNEVAVQTAF